MLSPWYGEQCIGLNRLIVLELVLQTLQFCKTLLKKGEGICWFREIRGKQQFG
jgi:hypothetical protein